MNRAEGLLRRAGIAEAPSEQNWTLLAEPILVFTDLLAVGSEHEIFNGAAARVGSVVRVREPWWRYSHHELRDPQNQCLLIVRRRPRQFSWHKTLVVCDADGIELASLTPMKRRVDWSSTRFVMAGTQTIGCLRCSPRNANTETASAILDDAAGKEVARITALSSIGDFVVQIHDGCDSAMRHVAVAAGLAWERLPWPPSGDG